MIAKAVVFFGQKVILICDAKCEKAWGIANRPQIQLSEDEDDIEYLADDELGIAPIDPGTYEGWDGKPAQPSERLNHWCARECERSELIDYNKEFELPDFSQRLRNKEPA